MIRYLDTAFRAFWHGLRWAVRRPLTSVTSTLCLAIGIAACAIAWTLLDATIFRPFGLADSDELVVVWEADLSRGHDLIEVSHLNFLDWQRESKTLESMAAFGSSHWPALARIGADTVPIAARGVSIAFFSTLGIRPALGRDFSASDQNPGGVPPVVLSHRMWQSRFGGDEGIVGQVVFIDGQDHSIVGVMPSGFAYPDDPDAWVSLERALGSAFEGLSQDQQRAIGVLEVLGRRRANVSNDHVREELTAIVRNLRQRYDPAEANVTAVVNPYADVLLGRLGSRLWIALGLAAAVFLFACANVGAVRMAQLRERATELAARLFLGSSRRRLAADLAVETIPVTVVSFVVAILAWSGLVALLSTSSTVVDSGVRLAEHRGAAVLTIALLSIAGWLMVGAIPAWVVSRREVAEAQLSSARVARRASAAGAPLLFGQAAVAIAVVAIAATALQVFDRLSRTDIGFGTSGVTLVDTAVPTWKYQTPADRRQLTERLLVAMRELSGVKHVAAVSVRPFRFGEIVDGLPVRRAGDAIVQPADATGASRVVATEHYFAALGQPIVEGRPFSAFDRADTESVAIVSRTLSRALWGDEPAVGKRLETFTLSEKWRSRLVVGVARDARYRGLERPSMEVYVPHTQAGTELGSLVLATEPGVSIGDAVVRQAMRRVEPEIAIERILTTRELVRSVLSPARLLATLTTMLGSAGLLLLTLGIFGAAATALRAAWAEIGVRQAIGAMPLQAAWAPLGILTRAVALGMGTGLLVAPLALAAVRGLGIASGDMVSPLVIGALSVFTAAAVAAGPSVWRASRRSPAELLREQ